MKRIIWLAAVLALPALLPGFAVPAAGADGIAVAIVYDTSGSMKEEVQDKTGHRSPKYVIANRALIDVTRQLERFLTNQPPDRPMKLEAGLFTFRGKGAQVSVPFGPFQPVAFVKFAQDFKSPAGNTPLGNALATAGQAVLDSSLPRKHVLVITDGVNTEGPEPAVTLPQLLQKAARANKSVTAHFLAFDVDARVFSAVKKQGATVVGAADEKQLNTQLDFILQKKILLEDEEK